MQDPTEPQDAATLGWVGRFIDSVSGAINTTVGIAYDTGTLFDYLKYGVSRKVDTVAALRALDITRNQRAMPLGYYTKGDGGGGPARYAVTGQPSFMVFHPIIPLVCTSAGLPELSIARMHAPEYPLIVSQLIIFQSVHI